MSLATSGPITSEEGTGEFHCPVCGNRCTRGPSGVEYGHATGYDNGRQERCPRRPDCVDPSDVFRGDHLGDFDD